MKPITIDELRFVYALLLDHTSASIRDGVIANDIMTRIIKQLAPQEPAPDAASNSDA